MYANYVTNTKNKIKQCIVSTGELDLAVSRPNPVRKLMFGKEIGICKLW